MNNTERECSNYEYEVQVPLHRLDALLEIAFKKDRDIDLLIWDALDEYIQREQQS
jgi:hypothetical protein